MYIPSRNVRTVLQSSSAAEECAANAYNFEGDINESYETGCILERKRVECALMLQAARADY